jgi:quercetin dioxygenase-like cupin family protein
MNSPSPSLARWDDLPLDKVTEMVARKVIVGADVALTQSYLKKGALVPWHAHRGGQVIYVLQGALKARLEDRDITVREGEVLSVPPAVPHQAEALDDTFVLDVRSVGDAGRAEQAPVSDR